MNQRLPLRRTVLGALAVFVGAMLTLTVYTLAQLHQNAIDTGFALAEAKSRNFEDYLTQSLQVTALAASFVEPHDSGELDLRGMQPMLRSALSQAPHLRSLSLTDETGRILVSSNPANVGVMVNLDDYLPQVAGTQGVLRIGRPWMGRDFADGVPTTPAAPAAQGVQHVVPLLQSVSVQSKDYHFLVALNPDYFVNHILQTFGADQGNMEVRRYDGTLLMDSDSNARVGSVDDYVALGLKLNEVESGEFELNSDTRGQVLVAYRASRLYPFVIVTHYQRDQALASWQRQTKTLLGVVIPALLVVCLLVYLFYRRQMQHLALQAESLRQQKVSATVFDASDQAIIIADPDGNIVSVNAAFTRINGYSAAEVMGRNPRFLNSGIQNKAFYVQLWGELLEHGVWRGELVNRRKDGTLYDSYLRLTVAHDPAGQVQHLIGVSSDITERKQAETALRQATQLAQAANIAKSRFLATMSHEIRTPMNGVLGMAQLLLMPELSETERDDYAQTILSSGQTLLTLLNDILDLSKIEAGQLQLDATVFEPETLLREASFLFAGSAQAKGLQLEHQWSGPSGQRYRGDSHRLRQMLSNLVGNAIKFTHQGQIHIEGGERQRDQNSALLEFSVSDSGIGIPPDKLNLLFQPFSQADNSTTRKFGGTGLGLSIVSNLAKAMGGDVGVTSEPGKGSKFWFQVRVDLASDEKDGDQVPQSAQIESRPGAFIGHLLVAEDNPVNAMVIESLLKKLGVTMTLAKNGQQAVDAITQGDALAFDLILMDLHMPVFDGYGATQQIRQWEVANGRQRVPIIALTADAFEEDRQRCLAAGMDDFLTKPISVVALTSALRKWLIAAPAINRFHLSERFQDTAE
jgi:PAS domain S-box-containing protein